MGKETALLKSNPAEIETVTVTMSRETAEAVAAACEMYLRLHMGQFDGLAEDLCMCKHYSDRIAGRFKDETETSKDFSRALHDRNNMEKGMDSLYYQFACHPLIEDGMRIPYRAEQVWLGIRRALAWNDHPEGNPWNVCFDRPINRSDQPQPKVELKLKAKQPEEASKDYPGECAKCRKSEMSAALFEMADDLFLVGRKERQRMKKPRTAITKRELANEDWKTSLARRQGPIPKGATVEILEMIRNLYGKYYWVKYQGETYYVDPRDLELQECDEKCAKCGRH